MSTDYLTPTECALYNFVKASEDLGWKGEFDEKGDMRLTNGKDICWAFQHGPHVMVTRYGANNIDGLAEAMDLVDEHDELFWELTEILESDPE